MSERSDEREGWTRSVKEQNKTTREKHTPSADHRLCPRGGDFAGKPIGGTTGPSGEKVAVEDAPGRDDSHASLRTSSRSVEGPRAVARRVRTRQPSRKDGVSAIRVCREREGRDFGFAARARTLESGSSARHASSTASEICNGREGRGRKSVRQTMGDSKVAASPRRRTTDRAIGDRAVGGRASRATSISRRSGAHLVRELVGVTLVDGLGGEVEGGTVLGRHGAAEETEGRGSPRSVPRDASTRFFRDEKNSAIGRGSPGAGERYRRRARRTRGGKLPGRFDGCGGSSPSNESCCGKRSCAGSGGSGGGGAAFVRW